MNIHKEPVANISLIQNDDPLRALNQLSRIASAHLKEEPGTYSLLFCIANSQILEFKRLLSRGVGKRRANTFPVRSFFESLQHIRMYSEIIPDRLLKSLSTHLSHLANESGLTEYSREELDHLVSAGNQEPLTLAYLAALQTMGFSHPYQDLKEANLASSVNTLYISEFDSIPLELQKWCLDQASHGVNLVLVSSNFPKVHRVTSSIQVTAIETKHPLSRELSPSIKSYPTDELEIDSAIKACESGSINVLLCRDKAVLARVEMECLLRGIPHKVDPVLSILNSLEMRLVITFIDFLVDESDTALVTLLEMAGVKNHSWLAYAEKQALSRRMQPALIFASNISIPSNTLETVAKQLGLFLLSLSFIDESKAKFMCFVDWCTASIPNFDTRQSLHIIDRLHTTPSPSLELFRSNVWLAQSTDSQNVTQICSLAESPNIAMKDAWLLLGSTTPEKRTSLANSLTDSISNSLIISHQSESTHE